jgi:hypothetical protein
MLPVLDTGTHDVRYIRYLSYFLSASSHQNHFNYLIFCSCLLFYRLAGDATTRLCFACAHLLQDIKKPAVTSSAVQLTTPVTSSAVLPMTSSTVPMTSSAVPMSSSSLDRDETDELMGEDSSSRHCLDSYMMINTSVGTSTALNSSSDDDDAEDDNNTTKQKALRYIYCTTGDNALYIGTGTVLVV